MDYLSKAGVDGIKLQLLHILRYTELERSYRNHEFQALPFEEYVDWVITSLEHLSPSIVIHRLTGDAPKHLLIAPLWSTDKRNVLNTIQHTLKQRNTWQGRCVAYHTDTPSATL